MQKATWILVANSANARIFKLQKGLKLQEIQTFIHAESRMHEKDLISDKPGVAYKGVGSVRVGMQQQVPPKKVEAISFAKQIADFLEAARAKGDIDRIFLAANPAFLGLLRHELTSLTSKIIAHEVDKDITHQRPEEIIKYFPIGL